MKIYSVGTDMRIGGKVRVQTRAGGLVEVDIGYHGICLGPDAFVGSGVWIAPGRVIAAGARHVRAPEDMVLRSVPHDPASG